MKYYVKNLLSGYCHGPFNTRARACAFIKKHHMWGEIIERVS